MVTSLRSQVREKDEQLSKHNGNPGPPSSQPSPTEQTIIAIPKADDVSFAVDIVVNPTCSTAPKSPRHKIVRDNGRIIYVGDSFWASLTSQLDDMYHLLEDADDEDESMSEVTPNSCVTSDLPFPNQGLDTRHQHPSPENRTKMWDVYKANIDPIIKLLHIPTIESRLEDWVSVSDTSSMPRNLSALLFSIYFIAVSSLEADACHELLGCDREQLLPAYRYCSETALMAAGLLDTDDLMVLQSFVLYLVALRQLDPRLSWTLCALGFRILQSSGAHRDGESLSLSAFNSEMYRRLAWLLCIMECGSAEDSGCVPTIFEISSFSLNLPQNLDDADIDPGMASFPPETSRGTEATLLIMWAEVSSLWRCLYDSRRPLPDSDQAYHSLSELEKKAFIDQSVEKIVGRYGKESAIGIQWVTSILSRLLSLEFKLAARQPLERMKSSSHVDRDELLSNAIECVDLSNKLQMDRRGHNWLWLFRTFTVWHALAYVLTELEDRPLHKDAAKAWKSVELAMVSRWHSAYYSGGHQWQSMLNLVDIARVARTKAVRHRRQSTLARSAPTSIVGLVATKTSKPSQSPQDRTDVVQHNELGANLLDPTTQLPMFDASVLDGMGNDGMGNDGMNDFDFAFMPIMDELVHF